MSPLRDRGSNGTGWPSITRTSIIDGCGIRRYNKADMHASGVYDWLHGASKGFNDGARDDQMFMRLSDPRVCAGGPGQ